MGRRKLVVVLFGDTSGGESYEEMVCLALADEFDVKHYTIKGAGPWHGIKTMWNLTKLFCVLNTRRNVDVQIITFMAPLLTLGSLQRCVVIVHHLGILATRLGGRFTEKQIVRKLTTASAVVCVCEYWEKRLRALGIDSVRIIPNGFAIPEFEFKQDEIEGFKERLGLGHRPLVFLGDYEVAKGGPQAYEALKGIEVDFVASSRRSYSHPGVRLMFLERRDYLLLLKVATVVITMSQFDEGWCRIAHESMLCATPVIGSGRGGMGELLAKGGQIVCSDFADLRSVVTELLDNDSRRMEIGGRGRAFANEFTVERFRSLWIELVQELA